MPDFNVRSDSVNVEQIMEQIRARIREKRGVDYTEEEIRQLATVKLEKFLDPRGVRSDLLDQFRKVQPPYQPPGLPNYAFEEQTLFESTRAPLRFVRRLLRPILKLFFNPNPLIQALHIQSQLNRMYAEREARHEAAARSIDSLQYEVLHNLVVEMTRIGIEVKNLKMRVESLTSRLEFNERRARALESVVVYKPSEERGEGARRDQRESREHREREREAREARPEAAAVREVTPVVETGTQPSTPGIVEGPGQRSRRRRRRRGRRGGGSAAAAMGAPAADQQAHEPVGPGDEGPSEEVASHEEASQLPDSGHDTGEPETSSELDQRITRPEPFQQTFGADTHPTERTASDPSVDSSARSETTSDAPDESQ